MSAEGGEPRVDSRSGSLARAGGLTLLGTTAIYLLAFVTGVIIARGLGPEGRGAYGSAVSVVAILLTVGEFGVGFSSVYFLARRRFTPETVAGNNIVIAAVLGLVGLAACLGYLAAGGASPFSGVSTELLVIALLAFPPLLISTIQVRVFLGLQAYGAYNVATVLGALSIAVAAAVTVVILGVGATGAIVGYTVAALASGVAVLAWVRHTLGRPLVLRPDWAYWRRALSYGTLNQIGQVLAFLNYRFDVVLLAALADARAAGLYLAAVNLTQPLWLASQAAAPVMFRRAAGTPDTGASTPSTFAAVRLVLLVTAVAAVGVGLLGEALLRLVFGGAFASAATALYLLLPGVVARSGSRVLSSDLAGSGRPGINAVFGTLTLALNIALNIWWIPRFGIEGAAAATSVSYSTSLLLRVAAYKRLFGGPVATSIVPRPADIPLLVSLARNAVPASWRRWE